MEAPRWALPLLQAQHPVSLMGTGGGSQGLRGRPSPMWSRSSPHGSWKPTRTWPNFRCPRPSCASSRPGSPCLTLASPMSWSGTGPAPAPLWPPLLPGEGHPRSLPSCSVRAPPQQTPEQETRPGGQESQLLSQLCRSPVPLEAAVRCYDTECPLPAFPACRDSQATDDTGTHKSRYRKAWTLCLRPPRMLV